MWHYNCTTYECVKTDEGTMILNYSMVCPPFNESECKMVCTLFYLRKIIIKYNLENNVFQGDTHIHCVLFILVNVLFSRIHKSSIFPQFAILSYIWCSK